MEYRDFKESIIKAVTEKLAPGCRAELKGIRKNNGVVLDAVVISREGMDASPVIYLEGIFKKVVYDAMPIESAAEEIIKIFEKTGEPDIEAAGRFLDFAWARERIIYRVVNRKKNEMLLAQMPHKDFLDLSVIFSVLLPQEGHQAASILVNNEHMHIWGTDTEALMELARVNTPKLLGWEARTLKDIICGFSDVGEGDMLHLEDTPCPMYVLTNRMSLHGASCLLYPGVLEEMAERMGGDYYVIPSSIHEIILFPAGEAGKADVLTEMIREVNRTQVAEEEVLSDHPYYYSRAEARLVAA